MPQPTARALLKQLAWPEHALGNKGTMTWSAAVGEAPSENGIRLATAAILVSDNAVTLRCRSGTTTGSVEPLLEAKWSFVGEDTAPELVAFSKLGQPQSIEGDQAEADAVAFFQDKVNLLGVRPNFQAFAERKAPAPKAPTP